jgi:hypothetical protein
VTRAALEPILQFCALGCFGELKLGDSWPKIAGSIGQPSDLSLKSRYRNGFLVDGIALYSPDRGRANLQVFVKTEHVTGIWLYIYGEPDLTPLCDLAGGSRATMSGAAGVDPWTKAFDGAGIQWRFDASLTFDDQIALLTQANVCCVWGRDEAAGTETLNKIGLSASDPSGRRTKREEPT